jgi:hypothetical protein
MANILLDAALMLVPSTTVTANTTYPAITAPLRQAPVCAWVVAISAVNNGPEYTFYLEWSTTQAGTYVPVATFVLPAITQPINFAHGLSGGSFPDPNARWLRLRVSIGGGGRSVTFASGLTKLQGQPGLANLPKDILANTAAL